MTNAASAFQPAIDALEKDLTDLERQGNALVMTINVLREKAGLPPRPGGWSAGGGDQAAQSSNGTLSIHSDKFTGKKLGSAVREYLEMRKAANMDAPATGRDIFDGLKAGGFIFGSKDEGNAMVVLRALLRKNTTMFFKLENGKYGLRSWYPHLKIKASAAEAEEEEADGTEDMEGEAEESAQDEFEAGSEEKAA